MDFGLSEEQLLLESTVRRYLDEAAPITRVREIAEGNSGFDAELWRGLAELGAVGVLIPEERGGSGLGLLDAAIVAQCLGRGAAPAPFLGSSVLAPVALLAGTQEQIDRRLPRIAAGELRVGAALSETFSRRDGADVRFEGGKLRGKSLFVVDAPSADALLVAARDDALVLISRETPGVRIEPLSTVDRTRRVGEAVFEDARPDEVLATGPAAAAVIDRVLDAGRVALAADALGAAEQMLERAVAYSQERHQFERLIGSFQAVKHMCAEMVAELEPARSLLWYAAYAFDNAPGEAPLMAAHAKAHLAEVTTAIAKTSTEVHGGIGFTDEQNLHVWFKRIALDRQLLGGPEQLRELAAALQDWA